MWVCLSSEGFMSPFRGQGPRAVDPEWFWFLRTGPSLVVAGLEEHLNTHPGHWAPRTGTVSYFENPVGSLGEPSLVGVCLTDLGQPPSVLWGPT